MSTVSLRQYWPIPVLLACFLLIALIISPRYEVPQSDDWAHVMVVQQWFQSGKIPYLGWNGSTLLFQVIWSAPFARIMGVSFTALRTSTLLLSLIGILCMYGVMRKTGASTRVSFLGASLLLFNPLYLILSYSFNTDVPYLAISLAATLVMLIAIEQDTWWMYLAGGLLAAYAYLIRPIGLLIPLTFAIYLVFAFESFVKRMALMGAVTLPTFIAAYMLNRWQSQQTEATWLEKVGNLHPFVHDPTASGLADLSEQALTAAMGGWMTLGIFVIPFAIAIFAAPLNAKPLRRPFRAWVIVLLLSASAGATILLINRQDALNWGWPYQQNYLTRDGCLAQFEVIRVMPEWACLAATVLAPILACLPVLGCARVLSRIREGMSSRAAAFVLVLGAVQFVPLFARRQWFDRELLVLLPAVLVATGSLVPLVRRNGIAAFVGLILFAVVSLEYARFYVDRSQAAWQTANRLVQRGVPPEQIKVGKEWDAAHLYSTTVALLGTDLQFDPEHGYPWDMFTTHRIQLSEVAGPGESAGQSYRGFMSVQRRHIRPQPIQPDELSQD